MLLTNHIFVIPDKQKAARLTAYKIFMTLCLKTLIKYCLFFALLSVLQISAFSQSQVNLQNIRVEELTDDQIKNFIQEADRMAMRDADIESAALQSGINPAEIAKLKERILVIRKAISTNSPITINNTPTAIDRVQDSIKQVEHQPTRDIYAPFQSLGSKNFGFDVFNNPKITFEPSIRIPTPKNYQLAADDELLIDVSGYSEANYKLKVTPEGLIRIPLVGPIQVSGLTVEQASRIIEKKLANTLYANIKTGNTFVDVSLGNIRSIKVTIIGEAAVPGTYTLPSLATAFNALYACGGANYNGTLRNIQVIRNSTMVSTIDVYQYLVNGNKKQDIRLMDQDVIKINTYATRIELKGEVKRPALYDVLKGENLAQVIQYAGGFTDNAYTAKVTLFSNSSRDRQISTINENQFTAIIPKRGDNYIVGKINNRFSNRIDIKGAVYRPGVYELRENMSLQQLIEEADGLREDAFLTRGTIHRLKDDLTPEVISFNLEKIQAGTEKDIPLKKEDKINIFSKFDLKEGYYVKIEGEVPNPGTYLFEEGMTSEDLIMQAGGFKESASKKRIEIARRIKDSSLLANIPGTVKTALIYQKDINQDFKSLADSQFILEPFDEISVYKSPAYFEQKNVVVEGEIFYAGKYTLEAKSDRISDLIKRSGGLTSDAYIKGAVLVRKRNLSKTEQANLSQGLSNLIKENYASGAPEALLQYEINKVVNKPSEIIGIDLERILDNPNSDYDLFLNDGDTLRIPKQLQTVRVNGEVLYPTLVRFEKRLGFKDYVNGAGGFSDRSSKRKSYAVYPNGTVRGTKSFLFFKSYPKITAGTEIYVPIKREKQRLRTGEVISIGATLTTLLLVTYSILSK